MNKSCTAASRMLVLVVGVSLALPLWAAARTTYKWLDDKGNITYGDYPPQGVAAQAIRISTGTYAAASAAAATAADTPVTATGQAAAVASAETQGTGLSSAKAAELCQQARSNLEILESHALIRQTDASGQTHILDDSSKQEQIATARDIIRAHCR